MPRRLLQRMPYLFKDICSKMPVQGCRFKPPTETCHVHVDSGSVRTAFNFRSLISTSGQPSIQLEYRRSYII